MKVFGKVFAQNKALRTQESVFLISKYEKKKKKKKPSWGGVENFIIFKKFLGH